LARPWLEQKLFIQLLHALGFATKTGTAATFSITLVSNFVKRKAFPKRFCHNDNNNSGNMFRGIDTALTIFMMRHKLQR
jgi:hypothetical protein